MYSKHNFPLQKQTVNDGSFFNSTRQTSQNIKVTSKTTCKHIAKSREDFPLVRLLKSYVIQIYYMSVLHRIHQFSMPRYERNMYQYIPVVLTWTFTCYSFCFERFSKLNFLFLFWDLCCFWFINNTVINIFSIKLS